MQTVENCIVLWLNVKELMIELRRTLVLSGLFQTLRKTKLCLSVRRLRTGSRDD